MSQIEFQRLNKLKLLAVGEEEATNTNSLRTSNKRRGSVVVSRARKGGTLMSACHLKVKRNIFSVPQENPTPAYRLPVYPTKTGKQRKELDFFFFGYQIQTQQTAAHATGSCNRRKQEPPRPGTGSGKSTTRIQRNFHRPSEAKKKNMQRPSNSLLPPPPQQE